MKADLVQALLQEVRATGSVRIDKKQLLWMLGRQRDHQSVWPILLNEWEEIGGSRNELWGVEHHSYITLVGAEVRVIRSEWAGE